MKTLVTGATGQVGYEVCRELSRRGVEHRGVGSAHCDVRDERAVANLFEREQPEAVIHCAAYTQVDAAEDDPARCMAINAAGTRNIALSCQRFKAKLLYISTDYVFPGTGSQPYCPHDPVGPKTVYGQSKLAGEQAVRELLERFFIVRVSWVFGQRGNNFVKTMLRLAESSGEVAVVADQIGSPTYTADLAPLLCDMLATDKYGTYHATNEGLCSWAEFAETIFRLAGKKARVRPLTTAEYNARAPRPLNSRLNKDKLDQAGFSRLPAWEDAVARFLGRLSESFQECHSERSEES